jgi:signal transduction histidine kinase
MNAMTGSETGSEWKMPREALTILVVDDDIADAELLRYQLADVETFQIKFLHASTIEGARTMFRCESIDLGFIDYRLGARSGIDLLGELRASGDLRPLIFITGQGDEHLAACALQAGADEYITKSELRPDKLFRAITSSIANAQKRQVERQNKELLNELQIKNEELEQNAKRLAELFETAHQFVNDVSHEFRTPLTVIKEFSSIIKDGLAGEVSANQQEYLAIVLDRVDDLSTMIDDMLDMSRLEAGQLGLRRKTCRIESMVERLRPTLDQKAALRNIRLKYELAPGLPAVYCDPEKIGRVIVNLSINAVKFSPDQGEIEIRAENVPQRGEVRFTVKDQGPGIRAESLKLLFERFAQVGTPNKSVIKGYGLGLNICKELVHLNLGDIGVESHPGKGSAFWFTLPTSDSPRLIRRYVNRVKALQKDVEFASLVHAQMPHDASQGAKDAAEQFLHQHIRRADLVLRIESHRWLIILACTRPEVVGELQQNHDAWLESNRTNPLVKLVPIHFEKRGVWKLGENAEAFISNFESAYREGEVIHA